jgi:hypothetical protein
MAIAVQGAEMTPAVEPAGVSEQRLGELIVWLDRKWRRHKEEEDLEAANALRELPLARQQLAELQRECEKSKGWIKHLKEQAQRDYNARKAAEQQLAEMRGRWIPFKPGDALPPRGAYLVCTKYNTGRPRDPIGRMETSRHTNDASAWNDYTVAYWSVPLPAPYGAVLAPTSQPSRGKPDEVYRYESCPNEIGENSRGEESCGPDCAQPERQGANEFTKRGGLSFEGATRTDDRGDRATEETGNDRPAAPISPAVCPTCNGTRDAKWYSHESYLACPDCPSPPQDDIVAGLRHLREQLSLKHALNVLASLEPIDSAIAALGEKGTVNE